MTDTSASGAQEASRRHTFPRSHRLKRRDLIRSLFDRQRDDVGTVTSGCIRLLYRLVDRPETGHDVPIQVGFAPGGRTSSAVQRNRIRRLLRETYRRHQYVLRDLVQEPERTLIVMMLFRSDPDRDANNIASDLPNAMERLASSWSGTGRESES